MISEDEGLERKKKLAVIVYEWLKRDFIGIHFSLFPEIEQWAKSLLKTKKLEESGLAILEYFENLKNNNEKNANENFVIVNIPTFTPLLVTPQDLVLFFTTIPLK